MKIIKCLLQITRLMFIVPGIDWNDDCFIKDLRRYKKIYKIKTSDIKALSQILWDHREFRNIFIYRNRFRKFYRYWVKLFYKPMDTLYIESCEIGGGLFIQHGFSTMIAAKSIGENCWVNQQVTIGFKGEGKAPIIGNDVMITCGAKVLGDIYIGNNVIIGANAVVVKDIKDGLTVGGVPAKVIK